jgi:hypothetical protein
MWMDPPLSLPAKLEILTPGLNVSGRLGRPSPLWLALWVPVLECVSVGFRIHLGQDLNSSIMIPSFPFLFPLISASPLKCRGSSNFQLCLLVTLVMLSHCVLDRPRQQIALLLLPLSNPPTLQPSNPPTPQLISSYPPIGWWGKTPPLLPTKLVYPPVPRAQSVRHCAAGIPHVMHNSLARALDCGCPCRPRSSLVTTSSQRLPCVFKQGNLDHGPLSAEICPDMLWHNIFLDRALCTCSARSTNGPGI